MAALLARKLLRAAATFGRSALALHSSCFAPSAAPPSCAAIIRALALTPTEYKMYVLYGSRLIET